MNVWPLAKLDGEMLLERLVQEEAAIGSRNANGRPEAIEKANEVAYPTLLKCLTPVVLWYPRCQGLLEELAILNTTTTL